MERLRPNTNKATEGKRVVFATPVKVIKHTYVENVLATLKKAKAYIRRMAI